MKPNSHAEMQEGPDALDRFRRAMKAIVSVPKVSAGASRKKTPIKKPKPRKP